MKSVPQGPIGVILNTNQLGGAERSLIEQLSLLKDHLEFVFFIPELALSDRELLEFMEKKGFTSFQYFYFPAFIYQLSRRNLFRLLLLPLWSPLFIWTMIHWHSRFRSFSTFYANGNKASFPVLAWSLLCFRKVKLYWHFRDFPDVGYFRLIRRCLGLSSRLARRALVLIANSQAVATSLEPFFPGSTIHCLYNLPGELPERKPSSVIRHLGIVSMYAPWKGLHTVLLMAALNEQKLKDLGIEKISFFGGNIYQTAGEHQSYSAQLLALSRKLGLEIVAWPGKREPMEIFSEIDLLIHPSVLPEPFGRIIIEAQAANIPVVSTSLGGARELIGEDEFGASYLLYDYSGLFRRIESFSRPSEENHSRIRLAREKVATLETSTKAQLFRLFGLT